MEVSSLTSSVSFPFRPSHGISPFSKNSHSQKHYIIVQRVSCQARKLDDDEDASSNDFYKMLSLNPKSATRDEIKKAYRTMALQYHPDMCKDPSRKEKCARMFVQLHVAYETLLASTK